MVKKQESNVELEITTWISQRTGRCVSTISTSSEFAAMGLDSVAMIELVAALESAIGVRLPEDTSQVCRTIGELAALGRQYALGEPRAVEGAKQVKSRMVNTANFVLPRFTPK